MYKLLLATDREDIQKSFESFSWQNMGFHNPLFASSSEEAIALLNSRAIDAVGFHFTQKSGEALSQFLHYERPSLSIFSVIDDEEKQLVILKELSDMLNRMHSDFSDEPYDDDAMRTLLRDELTHSLLCGEIEDFSVAERQFKLIRSHISFTRPCMVYELDMPQGDVYVSVHHNALERLERALRMNFFGRYIDKIYFATAVLTPRHIRIAAIPEAGVKQNLKDFEKRANAHVEDAIDRIKEFLDLDISIDKYGMIPNLKAFSVNDTTL